MALNSLILSCEPLQFDSEREEALKVIVSQQCNVNELVISTQWSEVSQSLEASV